MLFWYSKSFVIDAFTLDIKLIRINLLHNSCVAYDSKCALNVLPNVDLRWYCHLVIKLSCLALCLLLGPPGFNFWFSFAPVFQWCCSIPKGSPDVGRNTFSLSSLRLCFIIAFIRDFFPAMIHLHEDRTTITECFEP